MSRALLPRVGVYEPRDDDLVMVHGPHQEPFVLRVALEDPAVGLGRHLDGAFKYFLQDLPRLGLDAGERPTRLASSPAEAIPLLRNILADLDADREHFLMLVLNTQNRVTGFKVLATGGVAAAAGCLAAGAQQLDERVRRVGVLMPYRGNDLGAKGWLSVFTQGLQGLGWADSRNVQVDVRWAASNDAMQTVAKDLVNVQPDVILVSGTPATAALQRQTRTIPIVFVNVVDPVGPGFVASLPNPNGNITGFINIEAGMVGKWLELLTEIAPSVKRVAIMFNPDTAPYVRSYLLPSFEAAGRSLKVQSIAAPVHSVAEIEQVVTSLGREPRGGLIVSPDGFMFINRASIVSLTAQSKVATVYQFSVYVREGGLLSYGPNFGDIYRRAAPYVDRILRGTKPADLPVQLPVKFEMVLNTKTAKALGLTIPQSILLRADEVIE